MKVFTLSVYLVVGMDTRATAAPSLLAGNIMARQQETLTLALTHSRIRKYLLSWIADQLARYARLLWKGDLLWRFRIQIWIHSRILPLLKKILSPLQKI